MIGKREEIMGRIAENLTISERKPVEKRIRPALLDSIVGATLREGGITLPCVYGIVSGREDSIRLGKPAGFERELLSSAFRSQLFPSDFLFSGNQLCLYFPGQTAYLLQQVGPFLALTVLFMIVIVLCFISTIRTIVRQKQFSVRLMDFVNNMTHEFKTPISTIAVATETIVRPEVLGRAEKVIRYTTVIRDENARMKKQVDTILQMAVLEEGDYELKLSDVDLHESIRTVAGNVALQIEPDNGTIECRLEAAESVAQVDEMHFTNILHNVLDNACKYSNGSPRITVRTFNTDGNFAIDVTDRGIGIRQEEASKVFEKYYRVHTGNVHDVKGFGIGLSYVKLMTDALGGSVSLESELGHGTTVHLKVPLSRQQRT
jgi:two-component system phosphate regulon sensor histidine kinase PhoR